MGTRNPHPQAMIQYKPVTQAEHDTIVAALRLWQDTVLDAGISHSVHGWSLINPLPEDGKLEKAAEDAIDTAAMNGTPLDTGEVEHLIKKLKT